jgi:predicted nucleic acid-binding protein
VKALDTSALLVLLHGGPLARELLRQLRGLEVATTEANMLELQALVARGPSRTRGAHGRALYRLRRCLTVLPLDAKALDSVSRRASRQELKVSPLLLGMLGTLEANGCDELITGDHGPIPGRWAFRIVRLRKHNQ